MPPSSPSPLGESGEAMATSERRVSWWSRLLHRNYLQSARLALFLKNHIRPVGWLLLVLAAISALLGGNLESGRVFLVFGLLAGLLLVGLVWTLSMRVRGWQAGRQLPAQAQVGVEINYPVWVRSRRKKKAVLPDQARLAERLPLNWPTLAEFDQLREPWEVQRNAFDRLMAYHRWQWLRRRKQVAWPSAPQTLRCERHGDEERWVGRLQLIPLRRGRLSTPRMQLMAGDPLGIFQRVKVVPASEQELLVYPRTYRLGAGALPSGQVGRGRYEGRACQRGIGEEFLSLRDYQVGDPPRHLHWRSWARSGQALVKEFEEEPHEEIHLLLDCDTVSGEVFEAAVSVVASLVRGWTQKGVKLTHLFIGAELLRVGAGGAKKLAAQALRTLALVEAQPGSSASWIEQQGRSGVASAPLLVVLTGATETKRAQLSHLARRTRELSVIEVGWEKGEGGESGKNAEGPRWWRVEAGEVESFLAKLNFQGKGGRR